MYQHPCLTDGAVINKGPFLTSYSLPALERLATEQPMVLPICSLGCTNERLGELGGLVLPPLYHEALSGDLKEELLRQIDRCFPRHELSSRPRQKEQFTIRELPPEQVSAQTGMRVLAFSADTAVEEHGPHLPLATDTIQSYGVLARLAEETPGLVVGPAAEYGHLTWGLPFGFSIDLTPPLLTRYVAGFTNALLDHFQPEALYVVDVHGSIVHRNAIQAGLEQSRCERWSFRWLHEPLVEFAGERGDQHAGGVETAIVEHINPGFVDDTWFPTRQAEIVEGQLSMQEAIELSNDLPSFFRRAEQGVLNGVVGDIDNYDHVDGARMFDQILDRARGDVAKLL